MEEAEPQQRRRLEPPFLDLSPYPTLAGAVRQLDGTGASGPRRPPAGAARLRHAERPGSWPVPEGTASRVRVVAGGRWAWRAAGRAARGRHRSGRAAPALPAIAAGALLAANLVAADPGWLAARTRPAVTLRAE
jgi:hypothetical protein